MSCRADGVAAPLRHHAVPAEGMEAAGRRGTTDLPRHADDGSAAWLPVLHDGATIQLAVDHVVAVHANAHYTYVFDGSDKYFCQLAIGDVEARLDPIRFARVHRSHIINVERIVRLKKTGDNGLVELAGRDSLHRAGEPEPHGLGAVPYRPGEVEPAGVSPGLTAILKSREMGQER